jgi:hypothetical protein
MSLDKMSTFLTHKKGFAGAFSLNLCFGGSCGFQEQHNTSFLATGRLIRAISPLILQDTSRGSSNLLSDSLSAGTISSRYVDLLRSAREVQYADSPFLASCSTSSSPSTTSSLSSLHPVLEPQEAQLCDLDLDHHPLDSSYQPALRRGFRRGRSASPILPHRRLSHTR